MMDLDYAEGSMWITGIPSDHMHTVCLCVRLCCRFLPQPLVVDTYVVDSSKAQQAEGAAAAASSSSSKANSSSELVSMFSFYTLPSSVLGHKDHNELRAAYMFYTGTGTRHWDRSCRQHISIHC